MCQWTLEVHPVCFHGLARPTYLDRCEAGQPAEEHPDGCPEAQGSEADPVCVPVRDALGLPCVDASCGFFRNGPRWYAWFPESPPRAWSFIPAPPPLFPSRGRGYFLFCPPRLIETARNIVKYYTKN